MLTWIIGGVVVLVVAFFLLQFIATRMMAKDQERFERDGTLEKCWISSAGDDLYIMHDVPGAGSARVVFLLDDIPNRKARLKQITERLTNGEKEDDAVKTKIVNAFFEKINNQTHLDSPVRMPEWLVGDNEAYTGMIEVFWRRLPGMKLKKPYVYGRVILGENGGIRHVPYPAGESDE